MVDYVALGWQPNTVGELDHRLLKVPSIKLRSADVGPAGDIVYSIDFRLRLPNADRFLTNTELHSLEHFLLEGLRRLLPDHFISVGIMGCQTGFYLIFQNEGRASIIRECLESILVGILVATEVPYARIDQCGNYQNHSVEQAQRVAEEVLAARSHWMDVL